MSYIHFISAEIGARLSMQLDRLDHLHWDFEGLAHRANTARELARTARALLEALRLWYAEIEFAVRRSSARTSAMRQHPCWHV